jgi:ABC-type transport system involved in multi-copper enzyme maturation permease subunit
MNVFFSTLWIEVCKMRRSRVLPITTAAFLIVPIIDGLFMFILKDPERARSMGLISLKAQMTAAYTDWNMFFQVLLMGTAIAGAILFGFITAWIFGREYSDRTVKELLALPTPRGVIIGAKFLLIALWITVLSLMVFTVALGIGKLVEMPGWTPDLAWSSLGSLILINVLSFLLMPLVAFFASLGRGYLLPLGWTFLMMALSQIASVLGWGDWFPWSVPGLLSNINGVRTEPLAVHSYAVVLLIFILGTAATLTWWLRADQT